MVKRAWNSFEKHLIFWNFIYVCCCSNKCSFKHVHFVQRQNQQEYVQSEKQVASTASPLVASITANKTMFSETA